MPEWGNRFDPKSLEFYRVLRVFPREGMLA
jgi:hypothetical protein